jgi:hypothetical protein
MNETLPTGTARRDMTTPDLNIPYPPDGADPLTAAGFHSDDAQASTVTAAGAASVQSATGNEPALPGVRANGPKVAVSGQPIDFVSLAVVGPAAAAPAAPAGLPATPAVAAGNLQTFTAAVTAWGTQPTTAWVGNSGGDTGGDSDVLVVAPAPADLWYLDSRGPTTEDGVLRRERTEPAEKSATPADPQTGSPEGTNERSPAALDAFFGAGPQRAGRPIGSEAAQPAGVKGAVGPLVTPPDLGDGTGAGEVQVPAGGVSALIALLGGWWGARSEEPESRKQRRRRQQ